MSRKDYVNIANVLKEIKSAVVRDFGGDGQAPEDNEQWIRYVVEPFARMLEKDNPHFDPDKFINHVERR